MSNWLVTHLFLDFYYYTSIFWVPRSNQFSWYLVHQFHNIVWQSLRLQNQMALACLLCFYCTPIFSLVLSCLPVLFHCFFLTRQVIYRVFGPIEDEILCILIKANPTFFLNSSYGGFQFVDMPSLIVAFSFYNHSKTI